MGCVGGVLEVCQNTYTVSGFKGSIKRDQISCGCVREMLSHQLGGLRASIERMQQVVWQDAAGGVAEVYWRNV